MQKGAGEVALLAQTETGYRNLSILLSNTLLSAEAGDSAHCALDDIGDLGRDIIVLGGGLWQGLLGVRRPTGVMGWRKSGLKSWPRGFQGGFTLNYNATA